MQKHSVVADPNGDLFDITPLRYRYPFFAHPGSETEFWNLRPEGVLPTEFSN
jgi:hypothetical protein